jgi:hypothetical protein
MADMRPLAAIRVHKQVSRAAVAKALSLPVAKIEYFEDHAPLTTLEYLVNLKRVLGLSWSIIGSLLEEATKESQLEPAPLRGRGRPRKSTAQLSPSQLSTLQLSTAQISKSHLSVAQVQQRPHKVDKPIKKTPPPSGQPKRPRGRPRKQALTDTTLSALLGIK